MSMQLQWLGEESFDRIAEVRLRCYAHSAKSIEKYRDGIRADDRARSGDFLVAHNSGIDVGTATSLSLSMWIRGGRVPCQGVAYVGTIKTHRRGGRGDGSRGVASQIMIETLRRGREREEVVSALMPFRASFYEHFGYGIVETRNQWKAPLAVLPAGDFEGIRYFDPGDLQELTRCRQRVVEGGQCDIERPATIWHNWLKRAEDGLIVVDRPDADGPVQGWLYFQHTHDGGRDLLRVVESGHADVGALLRQLHFLASLRDQYAAVDWALPADLALHWLLKETQLPHRPVNHPTADLHPHTRMQLRVLDHKRLIECMHLPAWANGRVVVAVQEIEGHVSRFKVELTEGRASVSPSDSTTEFDCPDRVWASIACGELRADDAVRLGLASCSRPPALHALLSFAAGPRPYTTEYF